MSGYTLRQILDDYEHLNQMKGVKHKKI
jgi:hypothetical protein